MNTRLPKLKLLIGLLAGFWAWGGVSALESVKGDAQLKAPTKLKHQQMQQRSPQGLDSSPTAGRPSGTLNSSTSPAPPPPPPPPPPRPPEDGVDPEKDRDENDEEDRDVDSPVDQNPTTDTDAGNLH